jgi:hypothetical protein
MRERERVTGNNHSSRTNNRWRIKISRTRRRRNAASKVETRGNGKFTPSRSRACHGFRNPQESIRNRWNWNLCTLLWDLNTRLCATNCETASLVVFYGENHEQVPMFQGHEKVGSTQLVKAKFRFQNTFSSGKIKSRYQ